MKIRGERVLVFGDSISKHGPDAGPEIWDVDQSSARVSGQPGDLLASMLLEQGAEASRVNARVGRSAFNFFGREASQALLNADAEYRPSLVFIVLGTNDIGLDPVKDETAFVALKNAYEGMGATVWAIGPMTYNDQSLNAGAQAVVDMMTRVFGKRFIDGRPLSVQEGRAGDGVHFGAQSAATTAANMLVAIQKASGGIPWGWIAVGVAAVVGGMAFFTWRKKAAGHALAGGKRKKPDYDTSTAAGQKRLMDESVGREHPTHAPIDYSSTKDYGSDPLGPDENGVFRWRMVPSGDIVDEAELHRRLPRPKLKGLGAGAFCNPNQSPEAFRRCVDRQKRSSLGAGDRKPFKIATVDPAMMTPSQVNKELDKLFEQSSVLGDEMIAAGRGHERPSEYLKMTDPLSRELQANTERRYALRNEIELRYGPGAPSRFPVGDPKYRGYFKPRKNKDEGLGARSGGKDTNLMTRNEAGEEFDRLLKEPDPADMDIAQDLALQYDIKLADWRAWNLPRGTFELTPSNDLDTSARWHVPKRITDVGIEVKKRRGKWQPITPSGEIARSATINTDGKGYDLRQNAEDAVTAFRVMPLDEKATRTAELTALFRRTRYDTRIPDQVFHGVALYEQNMPSLRRTYENVTWAEARKRAARDAWVIAKALKRLPSDADEAQVKKAIIDALPEAEHEPSELFGTRRLELYGLGNSGKFRVVEVTSMSFPGQSPSYKMFRRRDDNGFVSQASAEKLIRAYKRQGRTVYAENEAGEFVPVKGAMRFHKSWAAHEFG